MSEETPPTENAATSMGMKVFNCDTLELVIRFSADDIDQNALLKAIGVEDKDKAVDKDGDIRITRVCGRGEKTSDYHTHVVVLFKEKGNGRVDIRYYASPVDIENEEPPHAEECAQWFGGHFKSEEQDARVTAGFIFDESFAPTIALPFPLATTEKALAGCSVAGVAVQFPPGGPLEMGIIQRGESETFVSAFASYKVRLKDFDLFALLGKLSDAVSSLVRKQDSGEEKVSAQ